MSVGREIRTTASSRLRAIVTTFMQNHRKRITWLLNAGGVVFVVLLLSLCLLMILAAAGDDGGAAAIRGIVYVACTGFVLVLVSLIWTLSQSMLELLDRSTDSTTKDDASTSDSESTS